MDLYLFTDYLPDITVTTCETFNKHLIKVVVQKLHSAALNVPNKLQQESVKEHLLFHSTVNELSVDVNSHFYQSAPVQISRDFLGKLLSVFEELLVYLWFYLKHSRV